jgi:beta-phosphoglucomutase-like phosphatase (HAD superfamily)
MTGFPLPDQGGDKLRGYDTKRPKGTFYEGSMVDPLKIRGKVVSGAGKAAYFTQVEWVQSQCREKLGFKPYPGTLNMEITAADLVLLEAAVREEGVDLIPPESGVCAARVLPLLVGSVAGAFVLPAKEVRIHEEEIVELIAPVCLREALDLSDGDEVLLFWGNESAALLLRGRSDDSTFSLKALIFDLDGTLIDTIPFYFSIVDAVMERLQMSPVSREAIAEAAKDGKFEWGRILPYTTETPLEELTARATAIVREVAPSLSREEIAIFTGVASLLKAIARQGVKMGIATSTPRIHLNRKVLALKKAGLDGLFHTVIAADDVPLSKPAPDPLLVCAAKMGVAAADCLYIGDMRLDIRAGRAAGMTTVGVLTGFDDYPSLESANPHLIVESVTALGKRLIF